MQLEMVKKTNQLWNFPFDLRNKSKSEIAGWNHLNLGP